MTVRTRTAPALPAKAVATRKRMRHAEATRMADRMLAQSLGAPAYKPDFGSITRAEMRQIVLDMIG